MIRPCIASLPLILLILYSCWAQPETLELVIADFEDTAQTLGLERDTAHVKRGQASGKWRNMDRTPQIEFKQFPRDWSKFNHLQVWIYSEKNVDTAFMIIASSENPKSEGPDYYGFRVPLNFTGWKQFSFPLNKRDGARSPIGLHHITALTLSASGWGNTPNPEAVIYMDDLRLVNLPKQLGPLTTDEEFFAALDLSRPGLETVRAATEKSDFKEAKAHLLHYMRSRIRPVWHFDWRARPEPAPPLPPPPPGTEPSDGMDYFSQTLTIDWQGWKHFRLPFARFGKTRRPVGWNYITQVVFSASGWGHTPDPRLVLHFDEMTLTGEQTIPLADFSTPQSAARWSGIQCDEKMTRTGKATARWERMDIATSFGSSQIPHDWSGCEALEFWCHSNAPTGAKIQIVIHSDAKHYAQREPRIMRHVFGAFDAEMYLGKRIDWEANPVARDEPHFTNEWTYCLNRFGFWNQLGDLYWAMGDEKYVREWMDQLKSWVEDQPVPYEAGPGSTLCWRTIECGIRMSSTWPDAYFRFLSSPSFDSETHALFLKSVREHARRLALIQQKYPERSGNWITMECNGLLHCAVLFPEFREAPEWMKVAVDRLNTELTRQVYPDGAQMELTSGYHQVCIKNFYGAMRVALLNEVALPGDYVKNLEKLYEYNLYAMMPNRTLAPLNDAGITDVRSSFAQAAELFKRPDFKWAASDGASGAPPKVTSYAFPYAGQFIMRSGWEKNDKFLLFEGGPFGISHQHEDKLTLFMWAFGRVLITEPGNYKYDHSKWRRHVLSTFAHNTIVVDGLEQNRKAVKETWQTSRPLTEGPDAPCRWFTSDSMDFARAAYDSGYGPKNDKSVSHERTVIFVKPDYWLVVDRLLGHGRHKFESLYHLDSEDAQVDAATNSVRTQNPDANVLLVPFSPIPLDVKVVKGQEDPVQGWIPAQRRKIPCVIFGTETTCPLIMATLLYPYPGASAPLVRLQKLDSSEGLAFKIMGQSGIQDIIFLRWQAKGAARFGEYTTDAEAALVRIAPTGEVKTMTRMGGSFLNKQQERPPDAQKPDAR